MIRLLLIISLTLLCVGCANRLAPEDLQGEWRFAYIIDGMAPPRYDQLEFIDDMRLRAKSTLDDLTFETTYTLTTNTLVFTIAPPGRPPITETSTAALDSGGLGLRLQYQFNHWQYFRPRFLPDDNLAGYWVGTGQLEPLHLTPEGLLLNREHQVSGYYRLFRSRMGKGITLVIAEPGHGTIAVPFLYKLRKDELELLPATRADQLRRRTGGPSDPIVLKRSPPPSPAEPASR